MMFLIVFLSLSSSCSNALNCCKSPDDIAKEVAGNDKMSNNYYMVYTGEDGSINSHSLGGNSGILQANTKETVWGHEISHNLGWKEPGSSFGGHSDNPSSIMYRNPSADAKVTQQDINNLNGGAAAVNRVGFGYGMRNYIYNSPNGKPIINRYPNVSVYK